MPACKLNIDQPKPKINAHAPTKILYYLLKHVFVK